MLEITRRAVRLLGTNESIRTGTVSSKAIEVVVGDRVEYEERDGEVFVISQLPAERNLYRSYLSTLKRMGANVDLLCVVTALGATLQPVVIDRMLVAAGVQGIPVLLIVNKIDLATGDAAHALGNGGIIAPERGVALVSSRDELSGGGDYTCELIYRYASIGIDLLTCSAKDGRGIEELRALVCKPEHKVVALCGMSGVGKSSLLNQLIPDAAARVGEVSERTGHGRQTTTQPRAFLCGTASDGEARLLVDLPGVQFFGLAHAAAQRIPGAFPEFAEFHHGCRYVNCRHLREPECGVRDAVERGEIAAWRYSSYCEILQEIEDAREY